MTTLRSDICRCKSVCRRL